MRYIISAVISVAIAIGLFGWNFAERVRDRIDQAKSAKILLEEAKDELESRVVAVRRAKVKRERLKNRLEKEKDELNDLKDDAARSERRLAAMRESTSNRLVTEMSIDREKTIEDIQAEVASLGNLNRRIEGQMELITAIENQIAESGEQLLAAEMQLSDWKAKVDSLALNIEIYEATGDSAAIDLGSDGFAHKIDLIEEKLGIDLSRTADQNREKTWDTIANGFDSQEEAILAAADKLLGKKQDQALAEK